MNLENVGTKLPMKRIAARRMIKSTSLVRTRPRNSHCAALRSVLSVKLPIVFL